MGLRELESLTLFQYASINWAQKFERVDRNAACSVAVIIGDGILGHNCKQFVHLSSCQRCMCSDIV